MTIRPLPLFAALATLALTGLVHGFWTQRWQPSQALEAAVARLNSVSMVAGTWKATNVEVDPEPYQQARAAGYWMRRYTREGSTDAVSVILMCGRAGHMATHTPEVCYRGAGFEMVGEPHREQAVAAGAKSAQLWSARFRQPGSSAGQDLLLRWTWSADGTWQAPDSPRLAFGGQPFLYKLYVVRETSGKGGDDRVTPDFLRELLPALDSALFPSRSDLRLRP
jgi:hypothetical protein